MYKAQITEAGGRRQHRSTAVCRALSLLPKALDALKILKPETVLRWHRAGFRAYWRWKSRSCGGRPKAPVDIRQLIREMTAVGSATDSRRTAQARHRCRPDERSKIHGKETAATVAGLEDLPLQSC